MPLAPSAFPCSGRLRRQAINLTLWGGFKPGGGTAPWGQRCIQWWDTPDRTVQRATRPAKIWPKHWRVTTQMRWACCICYTPHQRMSMAQGYFYSGSGRRVIAQTCPAVSKMPWAPLAFTFLGRLRRQAINLAPPRRPGCQKGIIEIKQELWQTNRAALT